MRVALATCRRLPEPDHDQAPLLSALRRLGVDAELSAWDDPAADLSRFDLCVIRSTWNYIHDRPGFLRWAGRAARRSRLLNPAPVVRWNSDKAYLGRLAKAGLPVVPTLYWKRGSLMKVLRERGWQDVVIKPRVGAASFMTRRFTGRSLPHAQDFIEQSAEKRPMMIQPYLPSVEGRGERSLVWIGGRLTHAVRKSPRLAGQDENVSRAVDIARDEARLAARALAPYAKDLLYARVDVARGDDGSPMIMELELIEPSLFLVQHAGALRLFAEKIAAAARRAA